MAFTYGFYNSLNGDRRYDAIQMSSIFDGIIRDGVFMSIGTQMIVKAGTGMMVTIGAGRAWFNHTWSLNDTEYPITLDQSEVIQDRIDTIVLDVNGAEGVRENQFMVVKGTPSASPVAPTLIDEPTHVQKPLADILVRRNTTVINQADITNRVGHSQTPFVTGVLDRMDIDALIAQWGDQWFQFYNAQTQNITEQIEAWSIWISSFKSQSQVDWNTWFDEFKNSSLTKFGDLEQQIHDILDEGAAGALLNMINAHEAKSVNDEDGVHEIRQKDGFIQTYRDGQWSGVMAGFMLPDLPRFSSAAASSTSISLLWEDPNDISLDDLKLAQWASTRIVRRFDRYPENENDGDIVVETTIRNQYMDQPYIDGDLIFGQEYFYQAFPITNANIVNRSSANRTTAVTGSIPPGDVIGLTADPGSEEVVLKWSDPEDTVLPTVIWSGTKVMRKVGSYPTDEYDGVLVVDSKVRDQYETNGYTDSGLENDVEYFYQAFPYATNGAVNREPSNRISATPEEYGDFHVYGVVIDESNNSPSDAVTYTDDAEGFGWSTLVNNPFGSGTSATTTVNPSQIIYANGLYVCVGNPRTSSGYMIYTSEDGVEWTPRGRTQGSTRNWSAYSVVYGNGIFVVTCEEDYTNSSDKDIYTPYVYTSPDGITWTLTQVPNLWHSLIFDGEKFMGLSGSSGFGYSYNGTTWTNGSFGASRQWNSIAYGNGVYVATSTSASYAQQLASSTDGINWTLRTQAVSGNYYKVLYGNGLFVAIMTRNNTHTSGYNNLISTSPDGINWTVRYTPEDLDWRYMVYGNGLFVALDYQSSSTITSTGKMIYSFDGITWKIGTGQTGFNWLYPFYGDDSFGYLGTYNSGTTLIHRIITSKNPVGFDAETFLDDIRPCLLGTNGKFEGYLNPNNYAQLEDGTPVDITATGKYDVVVEIPRMAYLITRESDKVIIKITDHPNAKTKLDSRYCYYAHSWETEGDSSHIYVGAYFARTWDPIRSYSGHEPLSTTLAQALRSADNKGDRYIGGITRFVLTLIQALFVVKFKTRNGRSIVGNGRYITNSGAANTGGMFSSTAAKVFGMEDFWWTNTAVSNMHVLGQIIDANEWYYCFAKHVGNSISDNWTHLGRVENVTSGSSFIEKIQGSNELGFTPLSLGGSLTTNWCSVNQINGTSAGTNILVHNNPSYSNLFSGQTLVPSQSNVNLYTRMMYFRER